MSDHVSDDMAVLDLAPNEQRDVRVYTMTGGVCTNCDADYPRVRIAKGQPRPGYRDGITNTYGLPALCPQCGVAAVIVGNGTSLTPGEH